MGLTERFAAHLSMLGLSAERVLVAVSGGPDSLALLDLLGQTRPHHGLDLVAAHLDHGIHPESGVVAERVRTIAAGYGLPVEVGRLSLGPGATETQAREQRYAWLEATR